MKNLRVLLDTNVVVSGLLFGGKPEQVLNLAYAREFEWISSADLLDELEKVLQHKKFGLDLSTVKPIMNKVTEVVEIVVPTEEVSVIDRSPGDNRVLEAAVEGRCSLIVTGDRRDLLILGSFREIKIISVADFLQVFVRK